MPDLKAQCTWGFGGSDATLFTEDLAVDVDITAEQARKLAAQLLAAADQADALTKTCEDHDDVLAAFKRRDENYVRKDALNGRR